MTATDNCDLDVAIGYTETRTDGSCPDNYTLTRVWTATDNCGNVATATQVITVSGYDGSGIGRSAWGCDSRM